MKKKSNTGLHVSKYDKPEPPKNEFSLGTARARTQQIVESIVKTYSYGLPRQDELEIIERLYAEKRGIDAQLEARTSGLDY